MPDTAQADTDFVTWAEARWPLLCVTIPMLVAFSVGLWLDPLPLLVKMLVYPAASIYVLWAVTCTGASIVMAWSDPMGIALFGLPGMEKPIRRQRRRSRRRRA